MEKMKGNLPLKQKDYKITHPSFTLYIEYKKYI